MTTLIPKFDLKNGGSTPVGAVNRPINEKLAEIVSAKDFGAKGDGTTDDTAALTAFFNAMTSNGSYYLPAGVYLTSGFSISKTSLSNVTIYGEGATILLNADQTSGQYLLSFTNCSNIDISGLTINGNAYILNAFYFTGCSELNFHHNNFNMFWRTNPLLDGFAFRCENGSQVQCNNNNFYRVNRSVIFDDDSTSTINSVVDSNTFYQVGFTCITTAHKNAVVTNNVMSYASLGPYADSGYTRTDMRNPAWMPTLITANYGGGKGPAINAGSGLPNAANAYPENLIIANNTINYTAEYGIGVEAAKYIGTTQLAGPAYNVQIVNNTIENTGIEAILVTACRGLVVSNNNILNSNLCQGGSSAMTVIARGIDPSLSSLPLATQQLNGLYQTVISGNTIRDNNSYCGVAISTGNTNIVNGLGDLIISNNSIVMSKSSCVGIYFANTSTNVNIYKVNILNNTFGMSVNSGSHYLLLDGNTVLNHSTVAENRFDGFTDFYYTGGTQVDFMSGVNEIYSASTASVNYPTFPAGTTAVIKSNGSTGYAVPAALTGYETSTANGPAQGFFGTIGQGTGGNYVPAQFVMGTSNSGAGGAWSINYNWLSTSYYPATDNTQSLGIAGNRWSVVYAGTGTINTSDANQKQQFASLTASEQETAKTIKSLIKTFKFNDAVAKKGVNARTHIGVSAQDVQAAFTANGLNADDYGLFCSDVWYELNGKSHDDSGIAYTSTSPNAVAVTQLGVRYEELLAFVIAAL